MQKNEFIGRRLVVHFGDVGDLMMKPILVVDYVWM